MPRDLPVLKQSTLPLSFLLANINTSQARHYAHKLPVIDAENTHQYYRGNSDKITFTHNKLPGACDRATDGWQFFISVLPEDRERAWELINPCLLTEDSPVLAFAIDDSQTRGEIPEEAFMLYTFRSRSGRLLQSPEAMFNVCQKIDKALNEAKICTGDETQCNTIKLEGFYYISLKYIDENIKRNQRNSKQSRSDVSTVEPYQYDNPYRRFVRGKALSLFKSTHHDDCASSNDEDSVKSELTCEL